MKFSPEVAYLLGLWLHCKSNKGIGVRGRAVKRFVEISLAMGLTESNKFQYGGEEVYFYHNRVKNALRRFAEARRTRLRFANEFSASYLAGWFDCCGEVMNEGVVLCKADIVDKFILTQLNFKFDEIGDRVRLRKPLAFLMYIKEYTSIRKNEINALISESMGKN